MAHYVRVNYLSFRWTVSPFRSDIFSSIDKIGWWRTTLVVCCFCAAYYCNNWLVWYLSQSSHLLRRNNISCTRSLNFSSGTTDFANREPNNVSRQWSYRYIGLHPDNGKPTFLLKLKTLTVKIEIINIEFC